MAKSSLFSSPIKLISLTGIVPIWGCACVCGCNCQLGEGKANGKPRREKLGKNL